MNSTWFCIIDINQKGEKKIFLVPPSKPVIRNDQNIPLHGSEIGPLEVRDQSSEVLFFSSQFCQFTSSNHSLHKYYKASKTKR